MSENKESDHDLLPVRMLNEYVYCPRLFYLEYVQGEFEESGDTLEGRFKHRRVDKENGELPEITDSQQDDVIHATSVLLSAPKAGLIARMDLVEGQGKNAYPVEYKKGRQPDPSYGIWDSDKVQIAAQAIILRENGYNCDQGTVYYSGSKQRISVQIDDDLIKWVESKIAEARTAASMDHLPPPLADSQKCVRCSLVSICLPDETNFFKPDDHIGKKPEIRRLYPARQDALPLYVQEQGATISKKGDELLVKKDRETLGNIRLLELSSVSIMGNIQISTQAVRELCDREIPICYFSTGGWFKGITSGIVHKNVELRIRQYRTATNGMESLALAKKFLEGKIRNSRTMLRRNSRTKQESALEELQKLINRVAKAKNSDELLGLEGLAGRIYFLHFSDMLKPPRDKMNFSFDGRNRRPPEDPVNAILSYVYSMLSKDFTISLMKIGLDPYMGFFHRPRYGKPSLALDLMEEFRPIVGDSVAITLINSGEIEAKDFIRRGRAVTLNSSGKRKTIGAYERRLDDLVNHPVFGYSISYRRIFEVQVRLLSRFLYNELAEYPLFVTR